MKTMIYDYDSMKRVGQLLELLTVRGMDNIRILAEIGAILDSGTPEIKKEKEKE